MERRPSSMARRSLSLTPVLVLLETTDPPEGVAAGVARLVGADTACILEPTMRLLTDPVAHAAMARATNPYGDGRASEMIVEVVIA